jgi:hypothetical protein
MRLRTTVAAGFLVVLAAAASVHADCNSPSPTCIPNPDGTGCCDPDTCEWYATNTKCRGEGNTLDAACKSGRCQADGLGGMACVLDATNDGAYVKNKPCIGWGLNVCNMGECRQNGTCDLSGDLTPVCPGDDNYCTNDCTAGPGQSSYMCGPVLAAGKICYAGTASACIQGNCQDVDGTATCVSFGGTPIDCSATTVGTCQTLTCSTSNGCLPVITPGADCDPTPDPDCDERACSSAGRCVKVANKAFGTSCSPGDGVQCTYDQCNHKGQCNYFPIKPSTEPCSTGSTDPCQFGQCNGTTTVCDVYALDNGTPCVSDSNVCTNQTCQAGACTLSGCNTGGFCAVCGAAGVCGAPLNGGCPCNLP